MSSTRLQTATAFLNTFATLDIDTLSSLLAESYSHSFGPASIASLAGPYTKDSFVSHIASLRNVMQGFPVYVTEIIESESSNAVWAWCTSKAEWRDEVIDGDNKEWEFRGEYVFMFWMDETGKRIVRCVEMLDSKKTEGVLLALAERAKRNVTERQAGK